MDDKTIPATPPNGTVTVAPKARSKLRAVTRLRPRSSLPAQPQGPWPEVSFNLAAVVTHLYTVLDQLGRACTSYRWALGDEVAPLVSAVETHARALMMNTRALAGEAERRARSSIGSSMGGDAG
jgi:hypothetical protein